ncbi:MAG TPA: PilN domain-containing protein [Candidatus Acidoferrales bacterium]|nr:PilN domain-containing protein [Candidatus Acidoferrales bacterium]
MFARRQSIEDIARRLGGQRALRLRRDRQWYRLSLRRPALGIEVGGSALHLACVRPGLGRRWLAGTETIADSAMLGAEQLRGRLNGFLARCGAADPVVILGLPRRDVIVRHLSLPAAAERALDGALRLQEALFKPNDDEEFCAQGTAARDGSAFAATLALLPRSAAEAAAGKFTQAGYAPALLTVTQFALADLILRAAPADRPQQLLFVHQRGREAEIAALRNRALIYSRSVLLPAGTASTQPAGSAPPGPPAPAEDAAAGEQLLAAVQEALTSLRWPTPQPVLLAGTVSPETEHELGETGRLFRLDEWMGNASLRKTKPEEHWGAIALAVQGLSWQGQYRFNLLPAELRARRGLWGYAPTYTLVAANLLLLAALGLRVPVERQILLKQYQGAIGRLEAPAAQADSQLASEKALRQRLALLGQFEGQGREPLDLLAAVARQLPVDAWLEFYNYQAGQLQIVGTAKSASGVLSALQRLPQVEDVKFNGALTRDDSGMEHFRLQMRLKGSR